MTTKKGGGIGAMLGEGAARPGRFTVKLEVVRASGENGRLPEGAAFFAGALYGWPVSVVLCAAPPGTIPPVLVTVHSALTGKEVDEIKLGPVAAGGSGGFAAALAGVAEDAVPEPEPIAGNVNDHRVWRGEKWEFICDALGARLERRV